MKQAVVLGISALGIIAGIFVFGSIRNDTPSVR